jgi:hypothetical protein
MKQPTTTICILYGFGEGPRVGKRFLAALRAAGFGVTGNPATADVIIAHSGGCFLIPEHTRARQIIQVGIAWWPGRAWLSCLARKLLDDVRSHHREGELRFWARKSLWNLAYACNLWHTLKMFRGRASGILWRYGHITTVVRPEHDHFCTPNKNKLPFTKRPHFVGLPGYHDDLWHKPQAYIDVIK